MRSLLLTGLLFALGACETAPGAAPSASRAAPLEKAKTLAHAARTSIKEEPSKAASAHRSRFLGLSDSARRQALSSQPIVEIEKGRGGRSLAFKLTLADGTQGYYKPEQTFSGAHWYAELMAYYLDRELGFERVPPVVSRTIAWKTLLPYAKGDKRVREVIVQEDGTVRGALIWWLDKKPTRLETGRNWEKWVRLHGPLHVSPYQRPIDWRRDRKSGDASEQGWPLAETPDRPERPRELSDMILFDYLCTNVDRWGGDNENVRTYGAGGPLLFFDNGAGFSPGIARISLMDARLHALERFSATTRARIDGLDLQKLDQRMQSDPLYPFLPERSWQGLQTRLQHARSYLEQLSSQHGERALF